MRSFRITLIFFALFLTDLAQNNCYADVAQDFLVTTLPRHSRLEIRMISQEPKNFEHKTSDNKLWLHFANPIQSNRVRGLTREVPKWLQDVRQDSPKELYFEAKRGNSFIVEKLDRSIIITILRDKDPQNKMNPEILVDKAPNSAELTLLWPKDMLPKIERDQDQLIFNFQQPINNPKLNDLWKALPQWITSSTAYYDSFVIRLAHAIKTRISTKGPQIIISFSYAQKSEKELQEQQLKASSPEIRLDRMTGQALLHADRDFEGRGKFRDVIHEVPENLEALRWLGDTEGHLKRWRKAIMVYDHMFSLDPQEYGVAFHKGFNYHEYGSYIKLEPEWWKVEGGETQWIARTSGRYLIGPQAEFDGVYEERYITDASLLTKNGLARSFEGSRRQGFGSLVYNFDSMDKAQIGVYGANSSIGGGASYSLGWKLANTKLGVNYHATDWNYIQQIANGGNVDSVNLSHDHQFGERFFLDAAASWNNFNLSYKKNVARSIRVNGAINYNVITSDPSLSVGYAVIAEYKGHRKRGRTPDGTPYTILPIQTREAHILTSRIGTKLFDYVFAEGVGGYSVDRFGSHGPVMGLAFYYEPISNFQFGIKGNREKLNSRGSDSYVNSVGVSFTVRF
jgi:hypothetical protein